MQEAQRAISLSARKSEVSFLGGIHRCCFTDFTGTLLISVSPPLLHPQPSIEQLFVCGKQQIFFFFSRRRHLQHRALVLLNVPPKL